MAEEANLAGEDKLDEEARAAKEARVAGAVRIAEEARLADERQGEWKRARDRVAQEHAPLESVSRVCLNVGVRRQIAFREASARKIHNLDRRFERRAGHAAWSAWVVKGYEHRKRICLYV